MTIKKYRHVLLKTLPVLAGYLFLGFSYGWLMVDHGFALWIPISMSLFVYAGSMQFIAIYILLSTFNPIYAFGLALMINARHLFYGISMLDRYQGLKGVYQYLVFGLTDETFSIVYPNKELSDQELFLITMMNHLYWIVGTILGVFIGSIVTINTKGLDFSLTALFIVIFIEQWLSQKKHDSALIGLIVGGISLLLFGQSFMIVALIVIVIIFFVRYQGRINYESN